ncbi:hypothetical protein N3K66_003301 [Trichothecium roseum]|uniref:Uncharacterized protein n=1 Tax=Trichothecium roseum TaxID=47278 RepID=A0ACC0V6L0_9HYPO|nr:hypothetical protein N3K66_003301 [Trichothecium roseum]
MAVGIASNAHHVVDEEARAEVDVLNSRLEKTTQLTKKIQASLGRLDTTGQSVRDVAGPLNGETRRLQLLGNNVDCVLAAIDRLRQPADSKNDEEQIIRAGPEKAGLPDFLSSIKRLNKAYADMQASNLRANQRTMTELGRLIDTGNTQLESHFDVLLRADTPRLIEPLHFITKGKPFPVLSQEAVTRLGLVYSHVSSDHQQPGQEPSAGRIYAEIRGPYISTSLANLAAASVNTAKKKNPGAVYRAGTNGMGTYAQAMEGLFLSEYDSICSIFTRDDWGAVFQATCQPAITELARTLRELNSHIKTHLATDCYLAYEITEIISNLSGKLEARTGELKEQKARVMLRGKSAIGVCIANSVIVAERIILESELSPLLSSRLDSLDQWRKKATALYTDICKDLSIHLFDTIHTNRTQRPTSGHAADSASIVKGLSSKDKDKIKEKFTQFNNAFEEMVSRHKAFNMEKDVRAMFGEDIRRKLQPLYERFWDRYHEIDKGKGKYVKYDKSSIAAVFISLQS